MLIPICDFSVTNEFATVLLEFVTKNFDYKISATGGYFSTSVIIKKMLLLPRVYDREGGEEGDGRGMRGYCVGLKKFPKKINNKNKNKKIKQKYTISHKGEYEITCIINRTHIGIKYIRTRVSHICHDHDTDY